MCIKFQVCIVFRLARRRDTTACIHKLKHKYTHKSEIRNILHRLLASRGFDTTGQSRRYAENPHDTAVFEASDPQDHFFEKTEKNVSRYGLGE